MRPTCPLSRSRIAVGYRYQVRAVRFCEWIGTALVVLVGFGALTACEPSTPFEPRSPTDASSVSNQSRSARVDWTGEFESPTGAWRLRYRPVPNPIPRNTLFELDLELLSADPDIAISAVEARMPEHQHGTTLTPKLHALGGGKYRVEGLLFHMSGFWELFFWVEQGANTKRVRFEVVLE